MAGGVRVGLAQGGRCPEHGCGGVGRPSAGIGDHVVAGPEPESHRGAAVNRVPESLGKLHRCFSIGAKRDDREFRGPHTPDCVRLAADALKAVAT